MKTSLMLLFLMTMWQKHTELSNNTKADVKTELLEIQVIREIEKQQAELFEYNHRHLVSEQVSFNKFPQCNGFLPSQLFRSEVLVRPNLLLVEDSEELDGTSEYKQTKDTIYVTALTVGFDMNLPLVTILCPVNLFHK